MTRKNGATAKAKASRIPQGGRFAELGNTGLKTWGGIIEEEFLHQLRGEQRYRVFREMADNDDVIGAMMFAVEMRLRAVSFGVEEQEDGDPETAQFVESTLDDMSHTFDDFISEWMATPVYGVGPFEIVWKRREGDQRDPRRRSKYNDGRIGIRKLAIRSPETIDRWHFDEEGGVQGFAQNAPPSYNPVDIPVEKLLLFRVRSRKGDPSGRSLLRNAYVNYVRKKHIAEFEAIGIERDLAGIPVAYVPTDWFLPGSPFTSQVAEIKNIVRNLRRGEQAGVVLPNMLDERGNRLLVLELLGQGGGGRQSTMDTTRVIQRLDNGMMGTIMADVIRMGQDKVGSFALSSTKAMLFAAGLSALLDTITETMNRHLVPRLLRLNGLPVDNPPRITHGDVESVPLADLAEFVSKMAGAGMPLFPDVALENDLRLAANLPPRPNEWDDFGPEPRVPVPFGNGAEGEDEGEDEGDAFEDDDA